MGQLATVARGDVADAPLLSPPLPLLSPPPLPLPSSPPPLQCEDKTERDRLLMFIDKLLYNKINVKLFLDASGVKVRHSISSAMGTFFPACSLATAAAPASWVYR